MNRDKFESDLNEELAYHLEAEIRQNIARGMPPEEARRQALLAFGAMEPVKEQCRENRWTTRFEILWQDLRYAARTLGHLPGYTLSAIAILTIGLGASITVFSIMNSTLLTSPRFPGVDRIVLVWGADANNNNTRSQVSFTDIDDVRQQNSVFEEIATFGDWTPTLSGAGNAERLYCTQVGDGFFRVLGTKPLLGRFFTPEEQIEGRDNVVVLSYRLWKTKFGGDPQITGKSIKLATIPHVVVGVLPESFPGLPSTLVEGGALYRPVAEAHDDTQRASQHLRAIARLRKGVTLAQAQANVNEIAARIARAFPTQDSQLIYRVARLHEDTVESLRPTVLALVVAACTLLILLCVNLANLLLVRGAKRAQEFAMRAALGASRWRLVRHTLLESVVLTAAGSVLALLLAQSAMRFISSAANRLNSQLAQIPVDARVAAFTIVIAALSAVLFGLTPALITARVARHVSLAGRAVIGGSQRLQNIFVAAQMALALALLVSAGLMVKSFHRLIAVDPGFRTQGRLVTNVWIPYARYKDPGKNIAFYQQLLSRVEGLPGVRSAALVHNPPMLNFDQRGFEAEGQQYEPGKIPEAESYFVTKDYFRTMGVSLIAGRTFTDGDNQTAPPVALVTERLAQKIWPGADPIGRRIRFPGNGNKTDPWRTIVGVVEDVKHFGLDRETSPALYLPFEQKPVTWMTLIVVSAGDPKTLIAPITRETQQIDPDVAPFKTATFDEVISDSLAVRRLSLIAVSFFAIAALLLSVIGLYAVVSYSIVQRTKEIGVRVALGARPGMVLWDVLRQGLLLAGVGLLAGAPLATAAAMMTRKLLFQVSPYDPVTILSVAALLICSAMVGTAIPAKRATGITPLIALRHE